VTILRTGAPPRVVAVGPLVEEGLRVAQDREGGSPYFVPVDALQDAATAPAGRP
jgi:hypothetical protein